MSTKTSSVSTVLRANLHGVDIVFAVFLDLHRCDLGPGLEVSVASDEADFATGTVCVRGSPRWCFSARDVRQRVGCNQFAIRGVSTSPGSRQFTTVRDIYGLVRSACSSPHLSVPRNGYCIPLPAPSQRLGPMPVEDVFVTDGKVPHQQAGLRIPLLSSDTPSWQRLAVSFGLSPSSLRQSRYMLVVALSSAEPVSARWSGHAVANSLPDDANIELAGSPGIIKRFGLVENRQLHPVKASMRMVWMLHDVSKARLEAVRAGCPRPGFSPSSSSLSMRKN